MKNNILGRTKNSIYFAKILIDFTLFGRVEMFLRNTNKCIINRLIKPINTLAISAYRRTVLVVGYV